MILPDDIVATVGLKDQYFDLRGLSAYSSLAIPTLRGYLKKDRLPHFKIRGKLLVKKAEFDSWVTQFRVKDRIESIVTEVINDLKRAESKH